MGTISSILPRVDAGGSAMVSRVRALAVACALLGVFAISFDIMWQRQRRQDLDLPSVSSPPAVPEDESSKAPAVVEASLPINRQETPVMQPTENPPPRPTAALP